MSNSLSRAFLLDAFVVFHFRVARPLTPPLSLRIGGAELARPFLAVPINGLAECFVLARLPAYTKKRNAVMELADAGGFILTWTEKSLSAPTKKMATQFAGDIPLLCSKLWKHLEPNFGEIAPETWRRITSGLSRLNDAVVLTLEDGRSYFRVRWPGMTSRTLVAYTLIAPESRKVGPKMIALLESGWLHGACLLQDYAVDGRIDLLVNVAEHLCLPASFREQPRIPAGSDPVCAILHRCPGDHDALREFMEKALAIRSPTAEAARQRIATLEGGFKRLNGTTLEGWVLDRRNQDASILLDIRIDGERAGSVVADQIVALDPGQAEHSHHGFRWDCDPSLLDGALHRVAVHLPEFPDHAVGEPFNLGSGHFDGQFARVEDRKIRGWIRERCREQQSAGLVLEIDGKPLERIELPHCREPEPIEFSMPLPSWIHDGGSHMLALHVIRNGQRLASVGTPISHRARFRGMLENVTPGLVSGWIANETDPLAPVMLDLHVSGRQVATICADRIRPDVGNRRCGFSFSLPPLESLQTHQSISLFIAGTTSQVFGQDRIFTPYPSILASLTHAAQSLKSSESTPDETAWVRRQVLAPIMEMFRKAASIPPSLTLHFSPLVQTSHPSLHPPSEPVDVIVPVHSGREETLACLESVLAAKGERAFDLIVVNDFSSDEWLSETLRSWARAGRLSLLENPANLGFVASVNRGMRLHPGRDAVILNADTLVPRRWLDRLCRIAYAHADVGTVTPFSNNATICSFPLPCAENPMPEGWTVDSLDAEFERANGSEAIDLPTAIGFCMYIKRQVIEDVGYFDEDQWGQGYGEENDFSLRAAAVGWRNVLACGVFVQHHGAVSFGDDRQPLIAAHLEKLDRLYPDYAWRVQKFIAEDKTASARNPIARLLLRRHAPRYLLFVSHDLGGGTQIALDDLSGRLVGEGVAVLNLVARSNGKLELRAAGLSGKVVYAAEDFPRLLEDLRELGIWHVHYHQILHFPLEVCDLPRKLGIRYDVSIHDYLPLCPRINMMDESGWYCGESQERADVCNRCVGALGMEPGVKGLYAAMGADVGAWRAHYGQFLKEARQVFFPSRDSENRVNRHFCLPNSAYRPPIEPAFEIPAPAAEPEPSIHVIAVIGAIGVHKGFDLLLACARSAAKEGLPLRFVVVGYTRDDSAFAGLGNVIITGAYQRQQLPALLREHRCSVAAFLSPWPETHCYALTDAWRSGLYAVAFDLGAQAERIRTIGYGELLPCGASPKEINKTLLAAARRHRKREPSPFPEQSYPSILQHYYRLLPPGPDAASGSSHEVAKILPMLPRSRKA